MQGLTERQKRVMEFLKSYIREHGYPPTMREIGEHFGFTWPAARGYLSSLEGKGFIRMNPFKSRGIEILDLKERNALEIPVAGRIRAGEPILAIEDIEDHIIIDRSLFRDSDAFALRVKGDSMVEAGIFDGDYVIVSPQKEIANVEIGVVLIGNEATVKKISVKGDFITLIPANRMMKPVTYRADEISIIGKVIGVIRRF
jgi:repressor LexA